MGIIVDFMIDNFMYVAFIAVLLVLALIGYIVDSSKNPKTKTTNSVETESKKPELAANIGENVKLGETIKKVETPVTPANTTPAEKSTIAPAAPTPPPIATIEPPVMKVDGPPKI